MAEKTKLEKSIVRLDKIEAYFLNWDKAYSKLSSGDDSLLRHLEEYDGSDDPIHPFPIDLREKGMLLSRLFANDNMEEICLKIYTEAKTTYESIMKNSSSTESIEQQRIEIKRLLLEIEKIVKRRMCIG